MTILKTYITKYFGSFHGVMDMGTQVQILDETVCISHSTDILEKGTNSTIFPPAMSK